MENASKALIIAGAILLAILIISLGLVVYNQSKETVGKINLTQQELEAFNSKFTSYEGKGVSGSQVNSLIQAVISSNAAEIKNNSGLVITVTGTSMAVNGENVSVDEYNQVENGKVSTGNTYTVVLGYKSGAVNSVTISEKK